MNWIFGQIYKKSNKNFWVRRGNWNIKNRVKVLHVTVTVVTFHPICLTILLPIPFFSPKYKWKMHFYFYPHLNRWQFVKFILIYFGERWWLGVNESGWEEGMLKPPIHISSSASSLTFPLLQNSPGKFISQKQESFRQISSSSALMLPDCCDLSLRKTICALSGRFII